MEKKWIPELDGLRVLMILIVSAYHIWQQSWLTPAIGNYSLDYLLRSGYVWVDGTVLMSAFLLYLPYARVLVRGSGVPDIRAFYRRRAERILPGYYSILALTFFGICLPFGLYSSPQFMVKDLATHLTFIFPFFRDTYLMTPLGAACWTLAIEVQAYVLFPWMARASLKHPGKTFGLMLAACFGFRAWCIWSLEDFNLVVNQLMNFLDLYVMGCLLALGYERLRSGQEKNGLFRGSACAATVLFLAAFWGLLRMLRIQAGSSVYSAQAGLAGWIGRILAMGSTNNNYVIIQRNQMIYRPVFGALFGVLMLTAPFSLRPLRKLLGNRVTHFLADISMNYYLAHQTVIVHMRRIGFPASEHEYPNQAGEQPWQTRYTVLAFGLSLLAAAAVTWLIEKPIRRRLQFRRRKGNDRNNTAISAETAGMRTEEAGIPTEEKGPHSKSSPGKGEL